MAIPANRRSVPYAGPRAAMGVKCKRFNFLSLGLWRTGGQSSLSHRLIFPLTACDQCTVLLIAELTKGRMWNRNLEPSFCLGQGLNPEPHDWQSSTLTTILPRTPIVLLGGV